MRNTVTIKGALVVALLASGAFALAQEQQQQDTGRRPGLSVPLAVPGPGWKTCPRCENPAHVKQDYIDYKVEGHPFDPHDISGVWAAGGQKTGGADQEAEGIFLDQSKVVFTPYGQKLYDATHSDRGPDGLIIANSKDPEMICDPLGYPRSLAYNYGFQFVQLKDRTYQFFEWGHSYRVIWTDGRKLPTDPPTLRFMGYSVGHWDGDTFIVESNGFDDRSWVTQDRKLREWGFPHTDEMTVTERYKRPSYGDLSVEITVTDPKVYAKPWVTVGEASLRPNTELWEYDCVPSESAYFNNLQTAASAGAKSFKQQ